ncbi:decaprenylphospho-beta-D-erythro-pentofuranosid-2-ulose 2-reductase [soil metagenome]
MQDALGAVQSVLVLGGGSEIALATVRRLVGERCRTVVLAARDPQGLTGAVAELEQLGATTVEAVAFDADDTADQIRVIDDAFDRHGDLDVVLCAFGVLGDQAAIEDDPMAGAELATTNYVGGVTSGLAVARRLRAQGHGTLVVLSSVAGERVRRDNYVYGSSKAGLDGFAQGLGDALAGSGARVMVVRPGFVHTRMTEGMEPAPFSTTADAVADAIADGLRRRRHTVWVPALLRPLFAVFRHLPRPVWRRVSAR